MKREASAGEMATSALNLQWGSKDEMHAESLAQAWQRHSSTPMAVAIQTVVCQGSVSPLLVSGSRWPGRNLLFHLPPPRVVPSLRVSSRDTATLG